MILLVLFFLKIALAIWDLLWFHTNFKIICPSSVKNAVGILIGITLIDFKTLNRKIKLYIRSKEYCTFLFWSYTAYSTSRRESYFNNIVAKYMPSSLSNRNHKISIFITGHKVN